MLLCIQMIWVRNLLGISNKMDLEYLILYWKVVLCIGLLMMLLSVNLNKEK